ncbi:MAG: lytic transglycosylase domain-containing protein [Alphaproteobacteria bacterium]|nr:lytic transglycosylase domain-containing protein [Alphaproteobacteria bacterium]
MRVALSFFALLFLLTTPVQARVLSHDDGIHGRNAISDAVDEDWNGAFAHARKADNPLVEQIIRWMYLQKKDSGATFAQISDFMERHRDWPLMDRLQNRAEEALLDVKDGVKTAAWLRKYPPQTPFGKRVLAEMMLQSGDASVRQQAVGILRQAWIKGDFDEDEEGSLLSRYGSYLTREDHIARADRLIWDDNFDAAKRMFPKIPGDYVKLFTARIAVRRNAFGIGDAISHVPQKLQRDPGLLFDRIAWRSKHGQDDGVLELLALAPEKTPNPERWWRYRDNAVRQLLREKQYQKAYALAKKHGITDDKPTYVDAEFMAGWIALSFQKSPGVALPHFQRIHENAKFPISRARGAYWAGKAAKAMGDTQLQTRWFMLAMQHQTTFYGQLAMLEIGGARRLTLPDSMKISTEEQTNYKQRPLVQAIYVLRDLDAEETLRIFLMQLVDDASNLKDAELAARVAREQGIDFGVKAAKRALRKGYILTSYGYPAVQMPADAALDKAMAHAVIRQESEFSADAKSPAGAVGLMQLLPSTAQHTAKRAGLPYQAGHLTNPQQNIRLGTRYLRSMINQFDGSKVMAIAAYNAGPGRVRRWEEAFGVPGRELSTLDWIEMIPFSETRNYVQRVIENMQVYRALFDESQVTVEAMRADLGIRKN